MDRLRTEVLVMAILVGIAGDVDAGQLGALISPGPLAKAHAAVEGAGKCLQCHETGRGVTVRRCLTCHQPIADRIARRTGVHRNAGTDCVACHTEHAGRDADLRRVDPRTFNHAGETGFPLDGLHRAIAADCSACHKTRSFLQARAACSSCHVDVHKGALGTTCAACHTASISFKTTRESFDHTKAGFTLTGAHIRAACQSCHVGGQLRGLPAESCSSCHQTPHRAGIGATCTTCHTTEAWKTRTVDHARTAFPLVGKHRDVACEKCHGPSAATRVRLDGCSACHANVHRDSMTGDCRACHTETGFRQAPFDHATATSFPLTGKHAGLACAKCHRSVSAETVPLARKTVDFGGASSQCGSCHADPHKEEFGARCESCHSTSQFSVAGFRHASMPEFFAGEHAAVTCAACHVPSPTVRPSIECVACHVDVHAGQVGTACVACHTVDAPQFAATRFSHQATTFPLTGRHQEIACAQCHPAQPAAFPTRSGTALRLTGIATTCVGCHVDPHLGQVDTGCSSCHTTTTFDVPAYAHPDAGQVFRGLHGSVACASCHKRETGQFPGAFGTAVRLKIPVACASCHAM
jgi:hypothetical protein